MKKIPVAVTAALVLVGCSAPAPTVDVHTNTPAPSTANSSAEQAVIRGLEKIDPGLTENRDRALRRSRSVCDSFARLESDEAKILDYTRQEFDGGHASVDAGKAGKILTAIRGSGYCA